MCSYYEAASSPGYSRDPQNGAEPLDSSDEGYDYQEPIPTILAKNFTADVSNMILRKGLARTKVVAQLQSDSIICDRTEDYCYALWSFDGNQNVTLNKQGEFPLKSIVPCNLML